MSGALVPPGQLAAIQKLAERGMQTPITIKRRSVQTLGQTIVENDLGDDVITYTETKNDGLVRKAMGWFWSTPTVVQEEDAGSLVTVNTYRLYVPVGTDMLPGDHVTVGAEEYVVSDTTAESTWKAVLRCSLRRRE